MKQKPRHPRRKKLIKPRLQLRLIGSFGATAALTLLLQGFLFHMLMTEAASRIPTGNAYVIDLMPSLLGKVLLFSFGLLLPLVVMLGVLTTFRVAGPVYRFEQYLHEVARGENTGPCKIRRGDELQELCDAVNLAVGSLRAQNHTESEAGAGEEAASSSRAA